ncbi:MAG: adenylate kinase family protein [Limisphaerales bacterium]
MKYRTILLFGPPGSGKGTQGRILGSIPGYFHIACGDLFRKLDPESPQGRHFQEYVKNGQLVPDDETVQFWRDYVETSRRAGRFNPEEDTLVLDGIPRTVGQATLMADVVEVNAVLYLTCPRQDKLIERMKRRAVQEGRLDDGSEEVIRRRMAIFDRDTRPVLDFYGPNVLHAIDATLTIELKLQVVLAVLNSVRFCN